MSEKQKQLVEEITSSIERLPPEKQYQLLGVAQGLGMVPVSEQNENKVKSDYRDGQSSNRNEQSENGNS